MRLEVSNMSLMKAIPSLNGLVNTEILNSHHCEKLEELLDMDKITKLRRLDLRYCYLVNTTLGLNGLANLTYLSV